MDKESKLYIGKQFWHLGRFWIDKESGQIQEDKDTEEYRKIKDEKTRLLAWGFGLVPIEKR